MTGNKRNKQKKKRNKDLYKYISLSVIIVYIIFIFCQYIGKLNFFKPFMIKSSLLEPFILLLTIIISFLGILYSNYYENRRQVIQAAEWRKKLLEFEQKDRYNFYDLFVLLSFINPFQEDDECSIDGEINEIIKKIVEIEYYIGKEFTGNFNKDMSADEFFSFENNLKEKIKKQYKNIDSIRSNIYTKVYGEDYSKDKNNLYDIGVNYDRNIIDRLRGKDDILFKNSLLMKELSHLLLKYNWNDELKPDR